MASISLCMITKDEENNLEQCLSSVKYLVEEIIIVDTGSKDDTKKIAKKFNAKIFDFRWNDSFSDARNESLKHATKDWILVLDADEMLSAGDLNKINKLTKKDVSGFAFDQHSYIEKYIKGAGKNNTNFDPAKKYPFFVSHFLVRLFRNDLGIRFRHRVHELVEDFMNEKKLQFEKADVALHHFGAMSGTAEKAKKYGDLILKQLKDDAKSARYNYQAARLYLGMKDLNQSLKYLEKTAKINPNYKLVFSDIAGIYMKTENTAKAIGYYRKSMEHNPDNPSPANNLAVVYMSIGEFGKAKDILTEYIKKFPKNHALLYNYKQLPKT